jgi:hypothetical protein
MVLEKSLKNLMEMERKGKSKQVAVYLKEDAIEHLDAIKEAVARINGTSISRNAMINDAVDNFMDEAEQFLLEEYGVTLEEAMKL